MHFCTARYMFAGIFVYYLSSETVKKKKEKQIKAWKEARLVTETKLTSVLNGQHQRFTAEISIPLLRWKQFMQWTMVGPVNKHKHRFLPLLLWVHNYNSSGGGKKKGILFFCQSEATYFHSEWDALWINHFDSQAEDKSLFWQFWGEKRGSVST